jgi:tetratricopeptide (TPR) repeat protein
MRILFKTVLLFLITSNLFSQDYYKQFKEFQNSGDTLNQRLTLQEWKAAEPKNPELYTSLFNYHFTLAQKEVVEITEENPGGEALQIADSTGKVAGYMSSSIMYDSAETANGLSVIDQGIKLHPNRLDMRFGKCYVLGVLKDYEQFTNEIIKTVNYSAVNGNEWTWTNNQQKEDGEEFFLSSMQDYQAQIYNTGNDSLLIHMRHIAEAILVHYPRHVESLTNISVTYLILGEYDKGLEPLLKAEKIDPKDHIVLANIARSYALKGDVNQAIAYYEKVILHGDPTSKEFAKYQIQQLQKDE